MMLSGTVDQKKDHRDLEHESYLISLSWEHMEICESKHQYDKELPENFQVPCLCILALVAQA